MLTDARAARPLDRASAWLVLVATLAACAPGQGAPAIAPPPNVAAPLRPAALPPDSAADSVLAAGVRHTWLWHAEGPWSVHVVAVDPSACGVELRSAKAMERVIGRETTSSIAAAAEATGRPVIAAVNADFFSFDPPGRPEGPQVSAGAVVKAGGAPRTVFGIDAHGRSFGGVVSFAGSMVAGAVRIPLDGVNVPPPAEGAVLYNRFVGAATPTDAGAYEIVLRHAGELGAGVVVATDTAAAGIAVASHTVVVAAKGAASTRLRTAATGDTLRWTLDFPPIPGPAREIVGGLPVLLRNGAPVHESAGLRDAFARARHPRTAVGWSAGGPILLLTVDGRQPPYSDGMTLGELADYFARLGATEAVNLDGGGSTTMVIDGAVANRPSDQTGERAVANALLVLGPAPGACTTLPRRQRSK